MRQGNLEFILGSNVLPQFASSRMGWHTNRLTSSANCQISEQEIRFFRFLTSALLHTNVSIYENKQKPIFVGCFHLTKPVVFPVASAAGTASTGRGRIALWRGWFNSKGRENRTMVLEVICDGELWVGL